jgi:hypothetical protein
VVKAYLLRQEDTKTRIQRVVARSPRPPPWPRNWLWRAQRVHICHTPNGVPNVSTRDIHPPPHPTLCPVREATLRPRSRLRSHLRLGGETRDLCV